MRFAVVVVETALAEGDIAPIVEFTLQHHHFAGPHAIDRIGAGADQRFLALDLSKFSASVACLGRIGSCARSRRFAAGLIVEGKPYAALADFLHLVDPPISSMKRRALSRSSSSEK